VSQLDDLQKQLDELKAWQEGVRFGLDALYKAVDDVLWYHKVGDVADINKVVIAGPPPANTKAQGPKAAGQHVRVPAYTFIPRNLDRSVKHPLLVLVHGGVHANFSSRAANIVRELVDQGYLIVAPEYRGSTGYGPLHYKLIDYGGLEVEDTFAARNWMVETCELVDPDRVGILGWSHGGLHTLMNIFRHPESYKVAYAGVPVSDLVARMGYMPEGYRNLYAADYHIGKQPYEAVDEYRRRSPAWNAHKLQTPLLIHTTTNDEDVNVLEVEHLIKSLKAAGKEFEYEVFEDAPCGHAFERIDTQLSRDIRKKVWRFLATFLRPSNPVT